jgi:DNA-directed RNA polymerase specialized sigma subunit
MTNNEKIKWLSRYLDNKNRYIELINELKLKDISAASITGMPSGSKKTFDSVGENLARLELLQSKQEKLLQIYREIQKSIEALEDKTERKLLDSRYLQGESFSMIGRKLAFTRRTAYRVHYSAVKKLKLDVSHLDMIKC